MPEVRDWFPKCRHGIEHQRLMRRLDGQFNIMCEHLSSTAGACYEKGPSINDRNLNDLILATWKEQATK